MKLKQIASNMTEVEIGNKTILFSYQTPVAYFESGVGFFKTNKKWSVTTSRHINKWLAQNDASPTKVVGVEQTILDEMVA